MPRRGGAEGGADGGGASRRTSARRRGAGGSPGDMPRSSEGSDRQRSTKRVPGPLFRVEPEEEPEEPSSGPERRTELRSFGRGGGERERDLQPMRGPTGGTQLAPRAGDEDLAGLDGPEASSSLSSVPRRTLMRPGIPEDGWRKRKQEERPWNGKGQAAARRRSHAADALRKDNELGSVGMSI